MSSITKVRYANNPSVKDYKLYFRGLVLLLVAMFLVTKPPHYGQSITQLLIPPIRIGETSRLYLSGVPVFFLLWKGYTGVRDSKVLSYSRIMLVIALAILLALMYQGIDLLKRPFYHFGGELNVIEINEASYSFHSEEDEIYISIDMTLQHLGNDQRIFVAELVLPEEVSEFVGQPSAVHTEEIIMYRGEKSITDFQIPIELEPGHTYDDILDVDYWHEPFNIRLFNDNDSVTIKQLER